jgi:hypothetical protein
MAQTNPASYMDPFMATLANWLTRNDDLHGGRDNDKKECKRLEKLRPRILALYYAKQDLLLACDKPIFELPIHTHMQLGSTLSRPLSNAPLPTQKSIYATPIIQSLISSPMQDPIH